MAEPCIMNQKGTNLMIVQPERDDDLAMVHDKMVPIFKTTL